MRTAKLVVAAAVLLGAAACQQQARQPDGAAGLRDLMASIVAASNAGDVARAAGLIRGLVPDEAALKKALRDDADPAVRDGAKSILKQLPGGDAEVAKLIHPEARTEINVHAATTEELARYEAGSVAYQEFPGGAKTLAEKGLRPGMTFYEVEFVEPGKDAGLKFHLFFHDGTRWRMLGPLWRALRGT